MKILITGGTHGMGNGVAKILAKKDNQIHEIIILSRSKELGESVISELKSQSANNKISIVLCDLTKLSDVKKAIIEIQDKHNFLDAIFINAGLGYAAKRIETIDKMDSHFQVNYLSQFMLTLNLLNLLENSTNGGRIIFNVTEVGEIFWDDMQMVKKWGYEAGITQAMVAKRLFLTKLNSLYREKKNSKLSFIGFQISKTVWSNQLNIIPFFMKFMAGVMRLFGTFISIEKCGMIMAPLFTENQTDSLKRSGKLITWKDNNFVEVEKGKEQITEEAQERLWKISLALCADEKTTMISKALPTK